MGFDEVVLLLCALLWVFHAVQLVRVPLRRGYPSLLIVVGAVGTTIAAWWLIPRQASTVAMSLIAVLLVIPAISSRAASRSLRWGRIRSARALATLAMVLRPVPAQRRYRRSVEVSWRLARGESIDVDDAVSSLGPMSNTEARAHHVVFLSWTNDFVAMASALENKRTRSFGMAAGMAPIITMVIGETGSDADLFAHYEQLIKLRSIARRNIEATWALVATAAYLGSPEIVAEQAVALRYDVPPDRIAFVLATAQQRAGLPEQAAATIAAALDRKNLTASSAARLRYRLHNVLSVVSPSSDRDRVLSDVAQKLRTRRALSALGLGFRQPAPLTWTLSLSVCAIYWWQVGKRKSLVFRDWGLISPFEDAPEYWRLLSYAGLHVDMAHLSVNLVGLLIFGRFVERQFGIVRMSIIYLLGAIAGGAAFLLFALRSGVAIGASGGVLALFGATTIRVAIDKELRRSPQGRRELLFLASIAALQLVVDALWAQSSGSAHAGGLVAGIALGAAFALTMPKR